MTGYAFITEDSLKSVATAAGITNLGSATPACPLMVGDFVTFPSAPKLAFRVTYRWLSSGDRNAEPQWYLGLEQAPHPLS